LRFLPPGRLLRQYKLLQVLGSGGFGVTYLAHDQTLNKRFAIKEYFPEGFANRAGSTIKPKSSSVEDFTWAKQRFLDEASILARFDHPNIAKVIQVFEANNTAYMVQEYESGRDLKAWIAEIDDAPSQLEFDCIVEPILNALTLVHRNELLHRDIAPDNIYIRDDGTPVLLDFGSAKDALAQRSKVSAIVKASYSPPELYSSRGRNQGPWSDIYSLAATLYFMIAGERPQEATERSLHDYLRPVAEVARTAYRPSFLRAVDWALKINPRDRPQSIPEWSAVLLAGQDSFDPAARANAAATPAGQSKAVKATSPSTLESEIAASVESVARRKSDASQGKAAAAKEATTKGEPNPDVAGRQASTTGTRVWLNRVFGRHGLIGALIVTLLLATGYWFGAKDTITGAVPSTPPSLAPPSPPERRARVTQGDSARADENRYYVSAKGRRDLLEKYLRSCKYCENAFDARRELNLLINQETERTERSVYEAARGSIVRLQEYLKECRLCGFRTEANAEISSLDAAEFNAARNNLDRLRTYVSQCRICGWQGAARAEIQKIEDSRRLPPAPQYDHWVSNGSILDMTPIGTDRSQRTFTFRIPNDKLSKQGVREGYKFFEGQRLNKDYKGVLYEYAASCWAVTYPVTGTIAEDDRSVRLAGDAPVIGSGCSVIRFERREVVLVFHNKDDDWGRKQ